jgi:hypothetical protein
MSAAQELETQVYGREIILLITAKNSQINESLCAKQCNSRSHAACKAATLISHHIFVAPPPRSKFTIYENFLLRELVLKIKMCMDARSREALGRSLIHNGLPRY